MKTKYYTLFGITLLFTIFLNSTSLPIYINVIIGFGLGWYTDDIDKYLFSKYHK